MLVKYIADIDGHRVGDIREIVDVTDARLCISRGLGVLASEKEAMAYLSKQTHAAPLNKMVDVAPINKKKTTRRRRKTTT